MAAQQARLRKELLGESAMLDADLETEKKNLERFQAQKKAEQDRRLKNIDMQKKTAASAHDAELKNMFRDYEDLLRRKKDEQKKIEDEAAALR